MGGKIWKVAVLTASDKGARGEREDKSGKIVMDQLKTGDFEIVQYEIIADDQEKIAERLKYYCDILKVNLVLTTGGTGFSTRDNTPEATQSIIEKTVPGIPEAMRFEGWKKTKRAMLSRGIAGIRGQTLIINLPGSSRGAQESLEAIIGELPHGLAMFEGGEH